MNDSILSGKWREIKGEVKKAWGELTENEIDRTEGNTQSLIGLLQQKFGYAKEEAQSKIDSLIEKYQAAHQDKVKDVADKANQKIDTAKSSLRKDDSGLN